LTGTDNILESELNGMNSFENEYPADPKYGSGILAGSTDKSPQTITYGDGMCISFFKPKNLLRNFELKKGKQ
jgi:hypothetical protein